MLDRPNVIPMHKTPSGRYGIGGRYHGWSERPEYWAWAKIVQRCTNPNCKSYKNYGARGIRICDRWLHGENGDTAFVCFIADVGERPSAKHSIDRINNDGHYEPGNVRWATKVEQENNKRDNRYVLYRGQRMSLSQATRAAGSIVSPSAAWPRIYKRGWSVELAVETPSSGRARA